MYETWKAISMQAPPMLQKPAEETLIDALRGCKQATQLRSLSSDWLR